MGENLEVIIRQKVDSWLDRLGVALRFDAKYLVKGSAYLFSASTLGMFMGMLLSITLARVLGEWSYGQFGLITSVIGALSLFSLPGMDTAISRAVAQGHERVYIRGMLTKARFAVWGALACVPIGLYFFYLKNDQNLGNIFYFSALLFIPLNVFSSYSSFLYGQKMFKVASRFYALAVSFSTCVTVLALLFTNSFYYTMLAYLFGNSLSYGFFFWRTLRQARETGAVDEPTTASCLSYGKHLTLMQGLSIAQGYVDSLLIAYFLSLPELATYMVAMAAPPQIKAVFKTMSAVLFPKMSLIKEQEVRPWVLSRVPLLLAASLLIGVACALIVPFAIPLLYSDRYVGAIPHAQILIMGVCLGAPGVILLELLKSQQRTRDLYLFNTAVPLLTMTLWAVAIAWKGLDGMVIARAMSWPLSSVVTAWLLLSRKSGETGSA